MTRYLPLLLAGLGFASCGEGNSFTDERLSRLERNLERVLYQETEEQIFLRNVRLLRQYAASAGGQDTLPLYEENVSPEEGARPSYSDFKSWSKQTLDGLATLFTGGGREP